MGSVTLRNDRGDRVMAGGQATKNLEGVTLDAAGGVEPARHDRDLHGRDS
jgi:hypothetical protein